MRVLFDIVHPAHALFVPDHVERQYAIRDLDGGPLMRKYGYGLEPEWQAKLGRDHPEGTASEEARTA